MVARCWLVSVADSGDHAVHNLCCKKKKMCAACIEYTYLLDDRKVTVCCKLCVEAGCE